MISISSEMSRSDLVILPLITGRSHIGQELELRAKRWSGPGSVWEAIISPVVKDSARSDCTVEGVIVGGQWLPAMKSGRDGGRLFQEAHEQGT